MIDLAMFSRQLTIGYLMNTNNFTVTARFSDEDVEKARNQYRAVEIETTEKVFSY
jgi:hypothetical protein